MNEEALMWYLFFHSYEVMFKALQEPGPFQATKEDLLGRT